MADCFFVDINNKKGRRLLSLLGGPDCGGAVKGGRTAGCSGSLELDRLEVVVDDVVRHAAGQSTPHLAGHQARGLTGRDAELEELLHRAVQVRPLIAVPVVAGVQERPPATARFLELVRQLIEHLGDFHLVLFDAAGVEADVARDAETRDVLAVVLAVLEKASEKDLLHAFGAQHAGLVSHYELLSMSRNWLPIY